MERPFRAAAGGAWQRAQQRLARASFARLDYIEPSNKTKLLTLAGVLLVRLLLRVDVALHDGHAVLQHSEHSRHSRCCIIKHAGGAEAQHMAFNACSNRGSRANCNSLLTSS